MKRLRTLSISSPDALDARNRKAAWGMSYWVRVNRRRGQERVARQARASLAQLQKMIAAGRAWGEAVSAAPEIEPMRPTRVMH